MFIVVSEKDQDSAWLDEWRYDTEVEGIFLNPVTLRSFCEEYALDEGREFLIYTAEPDEPQSVKAAFAVDYARKVWRLNPEAGERVAGDWDDMLGSRQVRWEE